MAILSVLDGADVLPTASVAVAVIGAPILKHLSVRDAEAPVPLSSRALAQEHRPAVQKEAVDRLGGILSNLLLPRCCQEAPA